jgi:hypothetical protein
MGGMFTTVKIREGLDKKDYRDPGWYKHPPETVAYEVSTNAAGEPERQGMSPQTGPDKDEHHQ